MITEIGDHNRPAPAHLSGKLIVQPSMTILPRPPKSPDSTQRRTSGKFMRDNWLTNRIFTCRQTTSNIVAKDEENSRSVSAYDDPRAPRLGSLFFILIFHISRKKLASIKAALSSKNLVTDIILACRRWLS